MPESLPEITILREATTVFEKQKKIISVFKELWNERGRLVKMLVKKNDVSQALLDVNRKEYLIILMLAKKWPEQQKKLENMAECSPPDIKAEYQQIITLTNSWFEVIGVHKRFLEVEKENVPLFISSKKSRQDYFNSLDMALTVYKDLIEKHEKEEIIAKSIRDISKNKITTFGSTTATSFKYGLYRILGATILGTVIFGDHLPGGNAREYILWALHVNIAGTILSFIDIKFNTAIKIKNIIDEIVYELKPTFNE